MRFIRHASLLAGLAAGSLAAQSPAPADPFLSRLIGTWTLTGKIGGKETTHDVSFSWALGHEYVAMHEVSRDKAADGSAAYEAIAYLSRDPRTSEYVVLWLDNTAASNFEPHGVGPTSITGDSLPFVFHLSPTDEFHTTFLYDRSADTWQWHMDDVQSSVAKPFARVRLRRQ